jgi:hypothetical protein
MKLLDIKGLLQRYEGGRGLGKKTMAPIPGEAEVMTIFD